MSTITLGTNTYTAISVPAAPGFSEIAVTMADAIAVVSSPFVPSQSQTQIWPGADAWSMQVTLPKMTRSLSAQWQAFLAGLRGQANVLQLGDPLGFNPQGKASGAPIVSSCVGSLALAAGGSGYTSAPAVSFSGGGGAGAAATAIVSGGAVTGLTLTNPGSAYTSAPAVTLTGGAGAGAAVTAQLSNAVSATLLNTRGWTPGVYGLLLPGDYLQIGYRLYMAASQVNADTNGNAQISVWPSLRETPADGATVSLVNCQGVFRLAANKRTWHTSNDQLAQISFGLTEVR
jgi:hypothetical protein